MASFPISHALALVRRRLPRPNPRRQRLRTATGAATGAAAGLLAWGEMLAPWHDIAETSGLVVQFLRTHQAPIVFSALVALLFFRGYLMRLLSDATG